MSEQSTERWQIHGRFVIDADTEDQASAACEALERAGRRSKGMANVTIHVHASEATEETCS